MLVFIDDLFPPGPSGEAFMMFADDLDELHQLAGRLGIPKASFYQTVVPHYRITGKQKEKAIHAGAVDGAKLTHYMLAEDCRDWWRRTQSKRIRDRRKS